MWNPCFYFQKILLKTFGDLANIALCVRSVLPWQGWQSITQHSADESVGKMLYDVLNLDDDKCKDLRECVENNEPCERTFCTKRKDNSEYWNYLRMQPVSDTGWTPVLQSIS